MKTTSIATLALAGIALAGCSTLSETSSSATSSASRGVEQVNSGLGSALQAPLEDLNLVRQEIPAVLNEAATSPYSVQGMGTCSAIATEIGRLDEALGPDLDAPATTEETDVGDKAADAAADATLDAVRSTVTDFIPARSWVRRLTGAHRHSQEVQAAVRAGLQRRAFLKGVGQQKNCAPPAAPTGYRKH
ncbi:hypothetical protein GCM10009093_18890 [Brevundimonas terrae]|uniref:Lipoprotein n=1 Tax=Brevundimonas terrae TaxID=363631 RepID=A0ABN0YEA1_9CAUL|nr:hypothetical protein [Brevundimonas terrae]NIJ26630.1 hypothetical protein [Brevundimonas terrae]